MYLEEYICIEIILFSNISAIFPVDSYPPVFYEKIISFLKDNDVDVVDKSEVQKLRSQLNKDFEYLSYSCSSFWKEYKVAVFNIKDKLKYQIYPDPDVLESNLSVDTLEELISVLHIEDWKVDYKGNNSIIDDGLSWTVMYKKRGIKEKQINGYNDEPQNLEMLIAAIKFVTLKDVSFSQVI